MRWGDVPLVCPECRATLEMDGQAQFRCPAGHTYPFVGGIPRFVAAESYAESFGYEWTRHRRTQVDSKSGRTDSHDTFAKKVGLGRAELEDRLVLDVGVGSGRFAEVAGITAHA